MLELHLQKKLVKKVIKPKIDTNRAYEEEIVEKPEWDLDSLEAPTPEEPQSKAPKRGDKCLHQ